MHIQPHSLVHNLGEKNFLILERKALTVFDEMFIEVP